jgi:hypothetical protein
MHFDLSHSGGFGTDLRRKNGEKRVFFCKKRALFVIFCAFFDNLALSLTILGGFGVVVT